MYDNSYCGLIDEGKIALIRARIRRWGLRGQDRLDAEQEVILEPCRFEYAPSQGASEATAIVALVDHKLHSLRRRERRYQKRVAQCEPQPESNVSVELAQVELRQDVRCAMESLAPEDRRVCNDLAVGRSIREIASRNGRSWHQVERQLARIREHFTQLGLGSAVEFVVQRQSA